VLISSIRFIGTTLPVSNIVPHEASLDGDSDRPARSNGSNASFLGGTITGGRSDAVVLRFIRNSITSELLVCRVVK